MKYNYIDIPNPENAVFLSNLKLNKGKKHLGDEFDLWIESKLSKSLNILFVAGYFLPGDVQEINGKTAKNASWLALQFNYHFKKNI